MSKPDVKRPSRRKWVFPAAVTAVVLGVGLAFPDLALLAFVAVLIVYLIEPVVALISKLNVAGRNVPRWAAVVTVYTAMLGGTIGFGAVVAPVLADEAATLAGDLPQWVRSAREEILPRVDSRVLQLRAMLQPDTALAAPVVEANDVVHAAADAARLHALFASALSPEEREAFYADDLQIDVGQEANNGTPVLFSIRPGPDGRLDILSGDDQLVLRQSGDGGWIVGQASVDAPASSDVLGRAFTDSIDDVLEASGDRVAEVLQLGSRLVTKLLAAIVGLFVTFMVAAFISIDVPRIVSFATSLFPSEDQPAVLRLLSRLNRGLSGVIRGQLAICLINAVLTGIGLLLFDVKFALLLAVIAGVMSLVPIFGTILSTIPCVLLALTQGFGTALLVLVWILVIHFIEANILQPKIMGSTARIHPVVVILALLAGEHAFGILGALVAVPIASVLQSLLLFARDEYARADVAVAPEDGAAEAESQHESHAPAAEVTDAPAPDEAP